MTEVLALIPARGGSKGVPKKNVLPLGGKPLIAHSIETAKACTLVTRTVVSTDDNEIARLAVEHGAEVPFMRPGDLARDDSPDLGAFKHALQWLRASEGYEPELVVHLRPTNPIRRPERVDEAIRLMLGDPAADSLRSVSRPAQTPYKMWRIDGSYLEPLLAVEGVPEAHSMPRQGLPGIWWQNGYVDVVRSATVLERESMTGSRVLPFIVQDPFVEIDYPEAFAAAEELLRRGGGRDDREPEIRHPA